MLIFSSHSNISPHVLREITSAVNKGIIIVPFWIEDITPSKSMEYLISVPHWFDAITPLMEQHFDQHAIAIEKILSDASSHEKKIYKIYPFHQSFFFCSNHRLLHTSYRNVEIFLDLPFIKDIIRAENAVLIRITAGTLVGVPC